MQIGSFATSSSPNQTAVPAVIWMLGSLIRHAKQSAEPGRKVAHAQTRLPPQSLTSIKLSEESFSKDPATHSKSSLELWKVKLSLATFHSSEICQQLGSLHGSANANFKAWLLASNTATCSPEPNAHQTYITRHVLLFCSTTQHPSIMTTTAASCPCPLDAVVC